MTHTHWTDTLSSGVYGRLCACRTIKADLEELVQARWNVVKLKEGFTKEDALIDVLDLLDCNSVFIDLSRAEYDGLIERTI